MQHSHACSDIHPKPAVERAGMTRPSGTYAKKRDNAARAVTEWEQLREIAGDIKSHTLSRLDHYLVQFEENAMSNGTVVHWACNAEEHNRIVLEILESAGVTRLVKSKSMLTEECGLNPFLERHGIDVVDTDLGERIVQLRHEPPSHIVLPAIHLKKEEVGELFHRALGTPEGISDPTYLTRAARKHLREIFLKAEAGLTGVNFGIAETGGFVVCTNEGNADLGTALPPIHIASMGIEKLIPRLADLGVFLRLLARSATGQPVTTYTSHYHGPREGQGPAPDYRRQRPQRPARDSRTSARPCAASAAAPASTPAPSSAEAAGTVTATPSPALSDRPWDRTRIWPGTPTYHMPAACAPPVRTSARSRWTWPTSYIKDGRK